MPERTQAETRETLCLELAGRRIATLAVPASWLSVLPGRLLDCRVADDSKAHRIVRMEFAEEERLLPSRATHDLNEVSKVRFEKDSVHFHSDWCEGILDLRPAGELVLKVHPGAGQWFGAVLENTLRLLTAYEALNNNGVLLHSAAIADDRRAVVLFGHSGAGKSTASAIALDAGWRVISDDVNLVQATPAGWSVRQVPFSGSLNANAPGLRPLPLAGLYRLHKADSDFLEPCSAAQSLALLCGSAPFVNQDAFRVQSLLDILADLVASVSVQELYFTRTPRFLDLVS